VNVFLDDAPPISWPDGSRLIIPYLNDSFRIADAIQNTETSSFRLNERIALTLSIKERERANSRALGEFPLLDFKCDGNAEAPSRLQTRELKSPCSQIRTQS
jgi:hypothetical protein